MAIGVAGVRGRLLSWWWDLPLRWKGSIAVALPCLVLLLVLAVLLPVDEKTVGLVAIGFAIGAALSWAGMWVFTNGIVQRIGVVATVAARVIDGETTIDVEEPAADELGGLIGELRRAGELLILHNLDLEQSRNAERERAELEQTIRAVVRRVHQAVGQDQILATAVHELGTATDSDGAFVFSVHDGAVGSVLAEWTAEGVAGLGVGRTLPPDEQRDANFGALVRQARALAIDDVAGSGLLPQTRELLGALEVGSVLLAPVLSEDNPLAAVVLITSGRTRPWPAGSESFAEVVAASVATALTQARLLDREREMVHRLQELDQAKSDFVASVSHELRTPLTSIRGYVEMLRDGDAGEIQPDQEHMLEVVQRNTDRLLGLIEDLLTLSRIESGAFRVALAPVALDGIVRATLEELRPQAAGRDVDLVADVAEDVPVVLGDAAQLERVLLNLLSNAIKFTTDGGRVVVRVRASGSTVELEVEDEGIGIPEAEQERLFSRFFRSSTSQERAIQGTGLGLAIVKNIVEHHSGEISVRSQPGVGTTFTVRLPAAAAPVGVT